MRGAKMLATGGIMANEVFVTCIQPLAPGDENYALSFAVPMNAKGLKILSRKSYEERALSVFDNPLAEPLRRKRRGALFRRRQGAVGAGLRRSGHRHVPEAVPRDAGARVPELPVPDPADGEAALSRSASRRRIAEANGIDGFPQVRETLGQLAAEGGHGRGACRAHGSEGPSRHGRLFRARPAHALCGAGADAAALSAGDHRRSAISPAAS